MSLNWAKKESRKAPGNEWPEEDKLWVKMLYLNWMEPDQIAERTGMDKRSVERFCGLPKLDWRWNTKQDDNFIAKHERLWDIATRRRARELAQAGTPDTRGPRPYRTHDPIPDPRKRPEGACSSDPHVIAYNLARGRAPKSKSTSKTQTSSTPTPSTSKAAPGAAASQMAKYQAHMDRRKAIKQAEAALAALPPLPLPFPDGLEDCLAFWPDKPWPSHLLGGEIAPAPPSTSALDKRKRKANNQDDSLDNDNDDQYHDLAPPRPRSNSPSNFMHDGAFDTSDSCESDGQDAHSDDARPHKRARTGERKVIEISSDEDDDEVTYGST